MKLSIIGGLLALGLLAGCGGTEADAQGIDDTQGNSSQAIIIPDCATLQGNACPTPKARQGCYNYDSGHPTPGLCICWTGGTWSCG